MAKAKKATVSTAAPVKKAATKASAKATPKKANPKKAVPKKEAKAVGKNAKPKRPVAQKQQSKKSAVSSITASTTIKARNKQEKQFNARIFKDTFIEVSGSCNQATEYKLGAFQISKTITVGATRGNAQANIISGNDIVQLEFADGGTWTGYASEVPAIYGTEAVQAARSTRGGSSFALPHTLTSAKASRGWFNSVLKFLHIVEPAVAQKAGEVVAKAADEKLMKEPGLFQIDAQFNKQKISDAHNYKGKGLLLIHGTGSSIDGSFGEFKPSTWTAIHNKYDYVIAYNHYTISVRPYANAADIAQLLPDGATFDIISHSRGGLVADALCRFDRRRVQPYSDTEIALLKKEDDTLVADIEALNAVGVAKEILIERLVRVACPAGGTSLMSKRLDHYLNAIINALKFSIGVASLPLVDILQDFLLDVIGSRLDADVMPGLWAMSPESTFQKINNNRTIKVPTKLYVIAGDSEIGGGVGHTTLVILSNLFYHDANDWIVDTKSMKRGTTREGGLYQYLSKDSSTCHFNYFKNENTASAVGLALNDVVSNGSIKFDLIGVSQMDRSAIGRTLNAGFETKPASGKRPIYLMIPGIMGSCLEHDGDRVWANLFSIAGGNFVEKLGDISAASKILAKGAISTYYEKFADEYAKHGDIEIHAFDWRKSLTDEATRLAARLKVLMNYGQPIYIVAHSMGGLLVKHAMIADKNTFDLFFNKEDSKVFLCGTPWLGSHMIMKVLAGQYGTLNTLSKLDLHHNKSELLEVIKTFEGLMQLLPMTNEEDFTEESLWESITQKMKDYPRPSKSLIASLQSYRQTTLSYEIPKSYLSKFYYIAGSGLRTLCSYDIRYTHQEGEFMEFMTSNRGDGSTLWRLSIPAEISKANVYYCRSVHEDILNNSGVLRAINDIIATGSTTAISNDTLISESQEQIRLEPRSRSSQPVGDEETYDALFFTTDGAIVDAIATEEYQQCEIECKAYNANLSKASYPVMVGHFLNDGLYSAEVVLDRELKFKLRERHECGFYPGNIGESEILLQPDSTVKGGIVVGLGKLDELTAYQLSQSVEKAIIKYSFTCRDSGNHFASATGNLAISTIIIASNYAGLTVAESIKAILQGVDKANKSIKLLKKDLKVIDHVEFVDYYEDIAHTAHNVLSNLKADSIRIDIKLLPFHQGVGYRKRVLMDEGRDWWHVFSTSRSDTAAPSGPRPSSLVFTSTAGRARVEQGNISGNLELVEYLAQQFSHHDRWDKEVARTMLELLIPNEFKNVVRSQGNILWKLDDYAAQFPWEMLHDYKYGTEPTFVKTGLIRQLYTDEYRLDPQIIREKSALVIGNPDYSNTNFVSLPGAEKEARAVIDILNEQGYSTMELVAESATEIIKNLYSKTYKIMHIAAHGIYEQQTQEYGEPVTKAGIVLGDGVIIDPATINQLSSVPEFIFINCCHLGDTRLLDDKQKNRSKLASNIGTQLIRMGVKAVVVAGWAVNDEAAQIFATTLYSCLFNGQSYGDAVKNARAKTYAEYPATNTWGAYQCYGDPSYKLEDNYRTNKKKPTFVTETNAIIAFENLLSKYKSTMPTKQKGIDELGELIEQAKQEQLFTPYIREQAARIYAELGCYDECVSLFEGLRIDENADFSVDTLELLASIRGKHLIMKFRSAKSDEYAKVKEFVVEGLQFCKTLLAIGVTAKRLCITASYNKRLGVYLGNKTYLKEAVALYQAAYEWEVDEAKNELLGVYPLLQMYLCCAILDDFKLCSKYFTKQSIPKLLDKRLALFKVRNSKTYSSYDYDNIARIHFCKVLSASTDAVALVQIDPYQKALKDSIVKNGNLRYVQGEIEHIELILAAKLMSKARSKALQVLEQQLVAEYLNNDHD